ncbi:MAG: enoyl-CoA hydratase-related protein [Xanthomonadales bacterium]|nr:enoyl-CoA hydratase-related protein [Xanthomonadales bacterium]
MTGHDRVGLERRGRVGIVSIRRPEVRNAIDGPTARQLERALDELEADEGIWAIVIVGQGPVFCAGADLQMIADGDDPAETLRGGFAGITTRERAKPLVAAVEGAAVAGGFEIVLACDLVVAAEGAVFGLSEVRRGLVAGGGGLVRLPSAVPRSLAMEIALLGSMVDAERLGTHGVVNRIVVPGTALDVAADLAAQLTQNPPIAVQESRAVVEVAASSTESGAWQRSAQARQRVQETEDFHEGPRAFLEGRDPVWTGR